MINIVLCSPKGEYMTIESISAAAYRQHNAIRALRSRESASRG